MFTQTRGFLESAVAVLLLLTTAGQSASLSDDVQTTSSPTPGNFTLTTPLSNGSIEEPLILRSYRPCNNNEDFCKNGGKCMYPQDSDKPSCICPAQYDGPRCMFPNHTVQPSRTLPELEHLIPICFGVAMFVIALAIIIYCCAYKRCVKSAPVKKPAPV